MEIRLLATLPKFSIEDQELCLTDARLLKIPFEEILELEAQQQCGDYQKQSFKYNTYPPVFFEKWIEVPDHYFNSEPDELINEMIKIVKPYISTCVCAIHFYTGIPILSPHLSAIYFDYRSNNNFEQKTNLKEQFEQIGAYRIYGESDKEYTFINESLIHISKSEFNAFKKIYGFLNSKVCILRHNELQSLIEPCQVLALPGIANNLQLILLTSALEAFLIPNITKEINTEFKKSFSNLCQLKEETNKQWLEKVYKLRSELIHGNNIENILEKLPFTYNEFLKIFTRNVITGFCKFLQYAKGTEEIVTQLELFRKTLTYEENDSRLTELLDISDYSKINNIRHQWNLNLS